MLTKRFDFCRVILLAAGITYGFSAWGQQPAVPGVVVRESAATLNGSRVVPKFEFDGHRFDVRNASAAMLIDYAYGLGIDARLVGAPDWTNSAHYDVNGMSESSYPVTQAAILGHQSQPALLALLQDKFHLAAHFEPSRDNSMALMLAKGKLRMKPASITGYPGPHIRPAGFGILEGKGATMDELASALTSYSMAPVVNETGLSGRYDFTLRWSPVVKVNRDDGSVSRYNMDGSISARVSDNRCVPGQEASGCNLDEALPTLALALPGELGLKLEPDKAKTLVIDHIERPANP